MSGTAIGSCQSRQDRKHCIAPLFGWRQHCNALLLAGSKNLTHNLLGGIMIVIAFVGPFFLHYDTPWETSRMSCATAGFVDNVATLSFLGHWIGHNCQLFMNKQDLRQDAAMHSSMQFA